MARFELAAPGDTRFEVGPRLGRVGGQLDLVGGELSLDSYELGTTRGHVTFDLSTLRVDEQAASALKAAERWSQWMPGSLTERARDWLQLDSPEQPQHRYARFSITHVGELSAEAAVDGKRAAASSGWTARRVTLRASGELELHGVRFPYTASVDARFEWPEPLPPGGGPARIELTTREPIVIDLTTHDIVPRAPSGEIHAEALAELRKGLGHQVRVSARWAASMAGARTPSSDESERH